MPVSCVRSDDVRAARPDSAVLLTGDFNSGAMEWPGRAVRGAGLQSAYQAVDGAEPAYTTWKVLRFKTY